MKNKYYLEYELIIENIRYWIRSVHNVCPWIKNNTMYRITKLIYIKFYNE